MSKTAEDYLIFIAVLYLFLALAALATAIFASSAAQSYPLYVVKPQSCGWTGNWNLKDTRFENSTDVYIIKSDWYLLNTIGACPKSQRDTALAAGSGANTADYVYHDCLYFTGTAHKNVWSDLDTLTVAANYTNTHFRTDAWRWENSGRLGQAATFFLYAAFGCFVASYWYPVTAQFSLVSILITFALWLGAVDAVQYTSMLDFRAWAAWFMESCDVRVVPGGGWYLGVYTLVVCGGFLSFYFVFWLYYLFRTFPLGHPFNPGYVPTAKDGPGGLTAYKSIVHFHKAIYLHTRSFFFPVTDGIPEPTVPTEDNNA